MIFKLPDTLATFVSQALTLNLADVATLRCRWPSVRDVTWASALAEKYSTGTASSNNLYASHLIAAALIGVNGAPLTTLVDDPEIKALLEQDHSTITEEQHAQVSEAKFKGVISKLPGDLLIIAYNVQMAPWLAERAGQIRKTSAEDSELAKVLAALNLLDDASE